MTGQGIAEGKVVTAAWKRRARTQLGAHAEPREAILIFSFHLFPLLGGADDL